jgi:hypothetical protein
MKIVIGGSRQLLRAKRSWEFVRMTWVEKHAPAPGAGPKWVHIQ